MAETVSKILLGGPEPVKLLCAPVEKHTEGSPQQNLEFRLQCRKPPDTVQSADSCQVRVRVGVGQEPNGIRAVDKVDVVFRQARYRFSRPIRSDRRSNYAVLCWDRLTGKRQRISLRAPGLDEALRNLADLRALLESGSGSYGTGPLISESLGGWVESLRSRRLRDATLKCAETWSRCWQRNFPHHLNQVTAEFLAQYFEQRQHQYALTTLNLELRMLKWFWHWATDNLGIECNPTKKLRAFAVPEASRRLLTAEEWHRILVALEIDPRFSALVRLARWTGLRARALIGLRWSFVTTGSDTMWLRLPPELLKSKRGLSVPLFPEAACAVHLLRQSFPPNDDTERLFQYNLKNLSRKWHFFCKRASVPEVKFHSLRAMFVTECRRRGVQLEVAMRLSDHSDVKTFVKAYRQVQDSDLVLAVRGGADGEKVGKDLVEGEAGGSGI